MPTPTAEAPPAAAPMPTPTGPKEVGRTYDPNSPYDPWAGRAPPFAGANSGVGAPPVGSYDPIGSYDLGRPAAPTQPSEQVRSGASPSGAAQVVQTAAPAQTVQRTLSVSPTNLAGKVALIKEILGLDSSLNLASAIQQAKNDVGLEAEGSLIAQADALLFELTPR